MAVVAFLALGFVASSALGDGVPQGTAYMLHKYWGGTWTDAEKTLRNSEDDYMCWAAAAANVLDWTGWGEVDGMKTSDQMFKYFQDHWTDEGSLMIYGWEWWFTGVNSSAGRGLGWARVDVNGGGGFHTSVNYQDFWHFDSNVSVAMPSIDTHLRAGRGTSIGIYGQGGHALTVWGFTHNPDNPSDYNGIYVTDSDDHKYFTNAPDALRYYEVEYAGGRWYLQDYYGSDSWYIGNVHALEPIPRLEVLGDMNGDQLVDATDIDMLAEAIRLGSSAAMQAFDVNKDGLVTMEDLDSLVRSVLLTDFGDFNLDGVVDLGDYATWASTISTSGLSDVPGWSGGDANGDGRIDDDDYAVWAEAFASADGSSQAVPEPATVILMGFGGMALLHRRRRR